MSYKPTHQAFHDLHSRQALIQPKNFTDDIHIVSGGFYTRNDLNMITWHPDDGNQRLVVLNDATGTAWAKIQEEQ